MTRICDICGREDKSMHYVVTLYFQLVCWECVSEAVDYYKEAMKED